MSFFVHPTSAPVPKTPNVRPVSFLLAAILMIMVVAQLFSFETFHEVIATMAGIDTAAASIWAAVTVTLEVAALPFLLGMALSLAARFVSMAAGWLVTTGWLVWSFGDNLGGESALNSGLLGSTVAVPGGWWVVFFCLGLCTLSAWASWGMWPLQQRRKRASKTARQ